MLMVPYEELPFKKIETFLKKEPKPTRCDMGNAVGYFVTENYWNLLKIKYSIPASPHGGSKKSRRRRNFDTIKGDFKAYFLENTNGGTHYRFCEAMGDWYISGSVYRREREKYCDSTSVKRIPQQKKENPSNTAMYQTIHSENGLCPAQASTVLNDALVAINRFTNMNFELVEYSEYFEIRNKTK